MRGAEDPGPPANPFHVREWTLSEFGRLLTSTDLAPTFLGFTLDNDAADQKNTITAIIEGGDATGLEKPPDRFRVVAVVTGYNEIDILPHTLRRLLADGLEVVYVDNWSTDGSLEAVREEFGESVRAVRFPDIASQTVNWADLLTRVETLGIDSGADWVIHHDADEIRQSPWMGVPLRDAIWNVDRRGFNAINHQVIDFKPVNTESTVAGEDPTARMTHWEHLTHPANLVQVKAWRNEGQRVNLALSGGHAASFQGRRIFPYRFLLRHYPLRSPAHARRKIFDDRASRWDAGERARGWHRHYDDFAPADSFVWPVDDLNEWGPASFDREFIGERLTGVGVLRETRAEWAEKVTNPPTAERKARNDALTAHAAELEALQASLRLATSELDAERARTDAAAHAAALAHASLRVITDSRSWQLTRPLRKIASGIRRMSNGSPS